MTTKRVLGLCALCLVAGVVSCEEPALSIAVSIPARIGRFNYDGVVWLRVANPSQQSVTLTGVETEALGLAPPFEHSLGGTCRTGGELVAGAFCSLPISFEPDEPGVYTDTVELRYRRAGSTTEQTVSRHLVLHGIRPLAITPSEFDFGPTPLESVREGTFTVSNTSALALRLGDLSDRGLFVSNFMTRSGGTCQSQAILLPGANCTLMLRYTPHDTDTHFDSPTIRSALAGGGDEIFENTFTVYARGTGALSVSTGEFEDPVPVDSKARKTLTVTNAGGAVATLMIPPLLQAGAFTIEGGACAGARLAPNGGKCSFDVEFAPTWGGWFSQVLRYEYEIAGKSYVLDHTVAGRTSATSQNCEETGCPSGQICKLECIPVEAPPPWCIAPCIWEARKNCLPVLADCSEEALSSTSTLTCNSSTGWSKLVESPSFSDVRTEYRRGATACFSEHRFRQPLTYDRALWSNGSETIALSSSSADGATTNVWCGSFDNWQETPSRAPDYVETADPACEDWKATYLEPTECRSPSPGSCSGSR